MMQRFWSWLAVEAGQARRPGRPRRADHHARPRLRHHPPGVRHRAGQLPQQGRRGLHRQRRLPGPLRRAGDARADHDGRRPHDRRVVRRRRDRPTAVAARRPDGRQRLRVGDHPADRAGVHRHARPGQHARRRPDPRHRRDDHPPCTRRRRTGQRGGSGTSAGLCADARTRRRDPRRGTHARQPRLDRLPALRQHRGDPPVAADVPQRPEPRLDRRAPARQPVDRRRGRAGGGGDGADERALLPERHRHRHRRADPPRRHQQLPARRDADARRHRRGDHDADPARVVRRPMAPAAPRRDPRRRRCGRSGSPATSASR